MKPLGHFDICIYILGRVRDLFLLQNILIGSGARPAHLPQHGIFLFLFHKCTGIIIILSDNCCQSLFVSRF